MEEKFWTKKKIITTTIAVVTLLALVVGASFSYFLVSINNTSSKTTIFGDIGENRVGTISLLTCIFLFWTIFE